MSAEVTPFPADRARPPLAAAPQRCAPCDLIVICVSVSVGLWCAFPVVAVDDDGWPVAVLAPHGQTVGIERVSATTERAVFPMADYADRTTMYQAMAHRTWRSLREAAADFAALGAL